MNVTRNFPRTAPRQRTEGQLEFLIDLVKQIGAYNAERGRELWLRLREQDEKGLLTAQAASDTITALKNERNERRLEHVVPQDSPKPRPKLPDVPEVPEGRFSVPTDEGHLGFYLVRIDERGRYTVKVYASDRLHKLPWAAALGVLRKIEADSPETAALRFRQESQRCYKCGRRLTQEHTRAAGVGDECASK